MPGEGLDLPGVRERLQRIAAGLPVPVEENRRVPGEQWMRWGPGVRRLAWAALGFDLRAKLGMSGLRLVGEASERIEVDEVGRCVWMLVEGEAVSA